MKQFIPFRKLSSATFLFVSFLFSSIAYAQTWTGSVSSDWGTTGNWSTNVVPRSNNSVIIPANPAGGRMPLISTGIQAVGTLTIDVGATLNQSGGTLQVYTAVTNNGQYLGTGGIIEMTGSTVTISGTAPASFPIIDITADCAVTMNNSNSCLGLNFLYAAPLSSIRHANNASLTVIGDVKIPSFPKNNATKTWDIGAGSASVTGSLYIGSGQESNSSGRFAKVIVTTGTLTVDEDILFHANAAQAGNAVLDIDGGAATVNVGGNITLVNNTGTILPGTLGSTVNFNGNAAQTINFGSNLRYNNIAINNPSGVKPGVAITTTLVTGNISVQSGLFTNNGLAIAGNSGKTFLVSNGATFNISGGGMVTGFATRTFQPTSTVIYSAAGAQTVSTDNYGHLSLSGSGVKTMPNSDDKIIAGNFTMSGTASATTTKKLVFLGDILLNAGTTFSAGGQSHTLGGDWMNNGATVTPTNSTFLLNGSSDQTIGGTVDASFYKVTVEKTAGKVVLSRDVTITSSLSLKKGIITTNAYKVIIPSGGSISDAGATSGWIAGTLQKYFSGNGYFEIGTPSYYTPVRMEFNSISKAGSLIASSVSSAHPNVATAAIANNKITRYWSFKFPTTGSISFATGKLTFTWNSADNYENQTISNMLLARYSSGSWSYPALDGTPTLTEIKANLVPSALGDFTVGQACAANFSYSAPSFCLAGGKAEPTLNAGATADRFSATPSGLSINPNTGAINLSGSIAGTYTVTNTITGSCVTSAATTISLVGSPSATIAYPLTPYCASGNAKPVFTGTTGGVFTSTAGLVIKAENGEVDLSKSRPDFYTVTYTIPATGGCPMFETTSQPFTMGKAIWKGGISTDWREGDNWSCGSKPSSSDSVIIPLGTPRYPVLSTEDGEAKDINIAAGASLKVLNKRLEIAGQIINNGLFEITNSAKLEFMGEVPQTIPASVFANNAIPGLTINNETSVTLMGPLDITHILTVSKGTFYTNGHLTLKSTQANTARLAEVKSSALQPIVGEVTVERYVPGRRKYRLVASSVTTSSKTVLASNETDKSIWGAWQNSGVAEAGKGTLITGGSSADGFDTQTPNASLYTYNPITRRFIAFNTASGKKTKYTPLKTGEAYYMFVYGDRLNKINATIPNPTVLKSKGTLAIGDQLYNTTSAIPLSPTVGSFTLLGNPYACTVDWKAVSKSNVSSTVWTWDANLNSTGGYVTITSTLLSDLVSPISSLVMASRYIQPGQGFFVKTTNTNPQVVIKESHKIDDDVAINSNVFRTTGSTQRVANALPLMALNLIYTSGGSPVLADGAIVAFDSSFSKEVTEEDGQKMANGSDVLGLLEDTTLLSIDTRPFPRSNDTLALNLTKLTKSQYTLEIFAQGMGSITAVPLLQDTYLNKFQPLSLTDTNRIVFNVTSADPASSDANRFRIVFTGNNTLPVTFVSVAATKRDKLVQVDWRVANETAISKYEVERSADGVGFVKTGEVAAKNSGSNGASYQWVDSSPAVGNNWYRIITVENNNGHLYSKTVAVMMNTGTSSAAVAPNPVKNQQILLHLKNVSTGKFQVFLYNHMGLEVWKSNLNHQGGNNGYLLHPTGYLGNGLYYLKIQSEKEKYILEIMVE